MLLQVTTADYRGKVINYAIMIVFSFGNKVFFEGAFGNKAFGNKAINRAKSGLSMQCIEFNKLLLLLQLYELK